jgi:hypothetical protein
LDLPSLPGAFRPPDAGRGFVAAGFAGRTVFFVAFAAALAVFFPLAPARDEAGALAFARMDAGRGDDEETLAMEERQADSDRRDRQT